MPQNGLNLLTPTSIAYTGTSATISANGSVSFTACSVLSLNGVFSADYDNYQAVFKYTSTAVGYSTQIALSAGGTPETSASNYYTMQRIIADSTTVSAASFSWNYMYLTVPGSTLVNGGIAWFYGPYLTQPTAYRSVSASSINNAYINEYAATHSLSTSYDGFRIVPASGNISGRVAVYGMRK